MIIDGHAHACGDFLTPESILGILNETSTDKVVLVPGELGSSKNYPFPNLARLFPSFNVVKITNILTKFVIWITGAIKHVPEGNEFVHGLVEQLPDRVIQFVWITKQTGNPKEYLSKKLAEWNFKGVKIHQSWEMISVDSDFFRGVVEWVEENDMPLFIHLFSDREVRKIIDYKKSHPKLKLIVAHLFGLELFIKADFKDTNLYFDISTYQMISSKRVMNAIEFVGAERIIMGSDTPYGRDNLSKNIERINNLPISESQKEMILGENLRRLLKI